MHKQISVLLLCLLPLASCTETRVPNPAPVLTPGDGGNFGHWTMDSALGPVFNYTRPEGVTYTTSYGTSDLHMHLIGNQSLNAFVRPEGGADIIIRDPGLLWLTRDPIRQAHLADGSAVVLPDGQRIAIPSAGLGATYTTEAEFGLGFVRFAPTQVRSGSVELEITRTLHAPDSDEQALVATTTLRNMSDASVTVEFEERWSAAMIPMLYGLTNESAFDDRAEFRDATDFARTVDATSQQIVPAVARAPRTAPADLGYYPPLILAALTTGGTPVETAGDVHLPTPMTLRWQLTLQPGASQTVAASFGTTIPTTPGDPEQAASKLLAGGLQLSGAQIPDWLSRELQWHAGQIRQSTMYDGATGNQVIGQGSAYLYLHGLDGAQRDYIHFVVALALVDPQLARDLLRYSLQMVDTSGHRYYAVSGYGIYDDAVIHTESTDLDLFILLGVSYYVLATRDFDFLDEAVAVDIGPLQSGTRTVLEHLRVALRHVAETTGFGPHGLLRVGTGDWSDGVIFHSQDQETALSSGESVYNTAMGAYVLPMAAEAVAAADATLAAQMSAWAVTLATATQSAWDAQAGWYLRGYGGPDDPLGGTDRIFLEHQPWALLAELGSVEQRRELIDNIWTTLDEPSPIGPLQMYPPTEEAAAVLTPGWDVNGGIWPAVHMWTVPAYATLDPDKAWQSMLRGSYAAHARAYPDIWYGIWSGPDSYNAHYATRPGQTFEHIATAMIDFPMANMNSDAAPLYMATTMAGIQPTASGITVDPKLPGEDFSYRTRWIAVAYAPDQITLDYRLPVRAGDEWRVRLPETFDGTACQGTQELRADVDGWVSLPLGSAQLTLCQ